MGDDLKSEVVQLHSALYLECLFWMLMPISEMSVLPRLRLNLASLCLRTLHSLRFRSLKENVQCCQGHPLWNCGWHSAGKLTHDL